MYLKHDHIAKLQRGYTLTAREIEYIKLLFEGINDNKELADKAENTLLTAKIHISNIYKKLKVSNKVSIILNIIEFLNLLPFDIKNPPETILDNFKNRYNLTNRELDIIKIICSGFTSNKEIGKELNIHFESSNIYQKSIYRKTFTHNKLSLILKLVEGSET
jgi:DNA-binding CsgD family transcriptional regulator